MKKRCVLIITVLTLAFSATTNASAQWVQVGLTADVIQAFAASGMNTTSPTLFAGSYGEGDGIFRSTNNGTNWTDIGLPGSNVALVFALAVIGPNTPTPMLFAGLSSGGPNFDSGGVYLTTNLGANWTLVNTGLTGRNVYALEVSGSNLFAGTDSGVFLSTNNGTSWTTVDNGFTALWMGKQVIPGVLCFAEGGASSKTLFAGTDFGVYRTSDDGASWDHLTVGFPDSTTAINALTISDSNVSPPTLLAGTYNHGVFLSTNNGSNWTSVNGGSVGIDTALINGFAVSGKNVFAASVITNEVYLSTNNGSNWTVVNSGTNLAPLFTLFVMDSNLFAGCGINGGVYRRPLSQMISTSVVGSAPQSSNALTAYPNPFSHSTEITFTTPEIGMADVRIVNTLGTEAERIFSGTLEAGEHSFSWDARGFAPGLYECVVKMNGRVTFVPIVLE